MVAVLGSVISRFLWKYVCICGNFAFPDLYPGSIWILLDVAHEIKIRELAPLMEKGDEKNPLTLTCAELDN